ncbi:MAG: glycosyltransferase family 2 protein [Pirellulaceae bacterium]
MNKKYDSVTDAYPMVSLVMAIRNEADFIARSFGAVMNQTYPTERLEVIVADGMSSDDTRSIVRDLSQARPEIRVSIVDNPAGYVAQGLNAALAEACGEVVVRVDGHTIIADDYVVECVDALRRTKADNVGGRMTPVGQGGFAQSVALATTSRFGVGGAKFHYSPSEEFVDTVYLGAWPRAVFDWIGDFDEEQIRNQDDEFNYRLREHGGKVLLSPRIQSRYYNRSTPIALFRQYFQYGYWKVRCIAKTPTTNAGQAVLSAAASSSHLRVGRPGHGVFGRRMDVDWRCDGIHLIESRGNVADCRSSTELGHCWLPITFAMLHMAYGSGFAWGLWKFRRHWKFSLGRKRKHRIPVKRCV